MTNVLIVDDEAPVRQLLQRWVRPAGVRAIEASSAGEALAAIADDEPAVAFCDVMLPDYDGIWLAEQLHARNPRTAIVLTTGQPDLRLALDPASSAVIDFLPKPFTQAQLLNALQQGLALHRERAHMRHDESGLDARAAEITAQLGELASSGQLTLNRVLALLQQRDEAVQHHARRVASLGAEMGAALGMTEPELADIERAALLHGPGYAHGPAQIVQQIRCLARASDLAAAMLERWDGQGTPNRLRGPDIPLGARVLSVVDLYDELVHGVGRPATTPEKALGVITAERGRAFDPSVVDGLVTLRASRH